MIDAMIISLRKELLSYIEWWRLYELFKILELPQCEMPNLSKDDIAKMLDIFSLTDEELYDEAPDSFFYILRELEKRLPFTLNPVPDGNDSEQSQDIKPTMSEPSNSPTATKQALPTVCNTDRERKYYARAIELGYMERTATGYKWVFGGDRGAKARLAYFLERVYCPKHTDTINAEQYRQLERLFGKTRLDRAVQTNADTGKTQRVKQWRAEIDKNVFFD